MQNHGQIWNGRPHRSHGKEDPFKRTPSQLLNYPWNLQKQWKVNLSVKRTFPRERLVCWETRLVWETLSICERRVVDFLNCVLAGFRGKTKVYLSVTFGVLHVTYS